MQPATGFPAKSSYSQTRARTSSVECSSPTPSSGILSGSPNLTSFTTSSAARWRLNRILALEAATLDVEMDRQRDQIEQLYSKVDEPVRCSMAFSALADSGRTLAILSNHETRLRRTLDRATAELRRLQTERREREQQISTNEPTGVELPSMQQPKGSDAETSAKTRTAARTASPGAE
jgi:hypothetical protein